MATENCLPVACLGSGRDLMCGAADHGVYHCRGHLFGKVSPMLGKSVLSTYDSLPACTSHSLLLLLLLLLLVDLLFLSTI